MTTPAIDAISVGKPRTLTDARGRWRSSIRRSPVIGPVELTLTGIVGDKCTQTFHGGPEAALCIHLTDHYQFWNEHHNITLHPGGLGENLTVSGLTEDQVFIGDIIRLGAALVQVSAPRVPCAKQARHVGRPDWVQFTLRENRTGFYMRVLEPGSFQPGDPWRLEQRINEDAGIPRINRCMYLDFDPVYARRLQHMPALAAWWQKQAAARLAKGNAHWMATAKDGAETA